MRRFSSPSLVVAVAALLNLAAPAFGTSAPASAAPMAAGTCTPARPHTSGTSVETIATADGTRTYRLHVPPSYSGSAALPLVFNMHGATSNATEQEFYSAFSAKADAEGFIVVYPQGLTTGAIPYTHFNAWMLSSPEPNDVGFITTLLDALEAQLCIDQDRVFSTGMSNGGMMSVRLACSLSGRIAAIAPVTGSYFPPMALNLNPSEVCGDTTAVPFIGFHGTADATVPFNGGFGGVTGTTNFRLPIDNSTPTEDVIADWSTHNGCAGARQESQVSAEVRLVQYGACNLGAIVQLYAVDGGGHTWPGAVDVPGLGYTTHQISATDLIWAFFAAHPKASAAPPSVGGVALAPEPGALAATNTVSSNDGRAALVKRALAVIAVVVGASGWYTQRRARR